MALQLPDSIVKLEATYIFDFPLELQPAVIQICVMKFSSLSYLETNEFSIYENEYTS